MAKNKKKANELTVLEFVKKTGFDVIEVYKMIDSKQIKSTVRHKKTFIVL